MMCLLITDIFTLQWLFHPLNDNPVSGGHRYLLSIQTAIRPFSGTSAAPLCVIVGEEADSGVREIRASQGLKVICEIII